MKRDGIRDAQLASLIAEEMDFILCGSADARLAELTVTLVEPKKGGGHFIVYVAPEDGESSFRSAAEVKAALLKAAGYLRYELAGRLNLKRTPELTFMADPLFCFPWTG